jgi:hypothetical protein
VRDASLAQPPAARSDEAPSAAPLRRRNHERGIRPDAHTGYPPYARDSLVPWSIEAAVWEALDPP